MRGLAGHVRELRFDPGKSWCFHFALADAMLAIEAKGRVEIAESKRKSRLNGQARVIICQPVRSSVSR